MSEPKSGVSYNAEEFESALKAIAPALEKYVNTTLQDAINPIVASKLMEQAKKLVEPELDWKLFADQAYFIMKARAIPITPEVLYEYANTILTVFKNDLKDDKVFVYDEDTGNINISNDVIMLMEYGDAYRPALKLLSKAMENAIVELGLTTQK